MQKPTIEQIKAAYERLNYKFFRTDKPFNLNLFGIRATIEGNDSFNDLIGMVYGDQSGVECIHLWQGTTDAGNYYRINPMNIHGTSILMPGQYFSSHKIGLHHGNWGLVQAKPLPVRRDNNRNATLETTGPLDVGMFGINIHEMFSHASGIATKVGNWSAGCQGLCREVDWSAFKRIILKSAKLYGNTFTYTLLMESQV